MGVAAASARRRRRAGDHCRCRWGKCRSIPWLSAKVPAALLRAFHPASFDALRRLRRCGPRAKRFAQTENRMAFVVPPLPAHLELRDLLVAALAVGGFLPAVLCLHRLALRLVPGRDAALRRVKRA